MGTLQYIMEAREQHYLPVKNYTTNVWSISEGEFAKFRPEYIREHFEAKRHPCWACQLRHCHMYRIPDGPYAGEIVEEPEYEQFAAWTALIGNTSLNGAVMLSKEVDQLGLDTNEAGWLIGWLMECYEKGFLTKEVLSGLKMTWGNVEATRSMLNMIAKRKGIGDKLAEGVMRAAKQMGGECAKFAIYTRKGNTPRGHDHRIRRWEGFDTCVSNVGTLEGIYLGGVGPQEWKELSTALGKRKGQMQFEDSMVTCRFNTRNNTKLLSEAVSASTGWDFTYEEAIKAGRRIVNLLRSFNARHGLTSEFDYPSPRYGSEPPDGPMKGKALRLHWDRMLSNYYKEMGWHEETGKPLPETPKKKLDLEHVVKDLWGKHEKT